MLKAVFPNLNTGNLSQEEIIKLEDYVLSSMSLEQLLGICSNMGPLFVAKFKSKTKELNDRGYEVAKKHSAKSEKSYLDGLEEELDEL